MRALRSSNALTPHAAIFFATFKFFESLSETKIVSSQSLHDVRACTLPPPRCLPALTHAAGVVRRICQVLQPEVSLFLINTATLNFMVLVPRPKRTRWCTPCRGCWHAAMGRDHNEQRAAPTAMPGKRR